MLVTINREMGATILISSHILDELAKFATRYGIIQDGQVLREFTREQLEQENRSDIRIESPHIAEVEAALREGMGLQHMQRQGDNALLVREGVDRHEQISRFLFDRGLYVSQFFVRHESLEDYFMGLTGGTVQ